MEHQVDSYDKMSTDELLEMEAAMHDSEYEGTYPFLASSYEIDLERVWRINDFCYKKGRYIRGYRKRRLFELMDLENIKGKKILDVGCGNGQHPVFFAMYGADVYAFDISKVGIEIGKKTAEINGVSNRCHFSVQNISKTNYEDSKFDIVVFNAVLHHVLKYPNVRQETLRILKKDGYVFFAEGLRENPVYRFLRGIYRKVTGRRPHGDIDLFYMNDIQQFAQGFSDVYTERFCLLLGIKALIAKRIDNNSLVRAILYLAKKTDDIILKVFPFLRRYCLEVVGVLKR